MEVRNYIRQLQEVQSGKLWIGRNFARIFAEVDDHSAFVSPMEGMHSIAQIIAHMTLWRQEAVLKIETGEGIKTDDCPENWPTNEELKHMGWEAVKSNYNETLIRMIELLEGKEGSFLEEYYYDTDFKGKYTYRFLIEGMLHHDLYHLGQLGIVLKYLKQYDLLS